MFENHVFECHMSEFQVYERLSVRKTLCTKGRMFEIIDKRKQHQFYHNIYYSLIRLSVKKI
jgi:hypothetical protein